MVLKQIFILAISFILSILFTVPAFRALALRLNIVDIPDGKLKKHRRATPYLGGLAIFTSLWLVLFIFDQHYTALYGLFWGTAIVLVTGLVDDIFLLTPLKKLAGQLISASVLIYYGFCLNLNWPLYADQFLSLLWLAGIINAFNLVDVMDGLAVTIGTGITLGLMGYTWYLNQFDLLAILLALLGAQLAFFCYNRPRATIYLGDAGSMLLGATLAAIALKINWLCCEKYCALHYLIAPIIMGIPIIEVISLILIRKVKNIPFYTGSHDHYIHYLKNKEWQEWSILSFTFLYQLLLFIFSVVVFMEIMTLFVILIAGLLLLWSWVYVVFFK